MRRQITRRKKLPNKVRMAIQSALEKADSTLREGCGVGEEHQEAMRLYLDTWVARPLHAVLAWDDGEMHVEDVGVWKPRVGRGQS